MWSDHRSSRNISYTGESSSAVAPATAGPVFSHRSAAAVSLYYFSYNFIKIHRTLRCTPAMAAGVTTKLWEVSDLVALWEEYERRGERAA